MRRLLILICLSILPAPAWADAALTPKMRLGAPVSIQAYGTQNPACLEWTNGCVLCVSGGSGTQCSTPGIACQPAGLTCKRLKPNSR